jgi:hypothetical protein
MIVVESQRAAQRFIGHEAETATLFGTSSVTFHVVAGGFHPRQLNRWAASKSLSMSVDFCHKV